MAYPREIFFDYLKSEGLRKTYQRELILETFLTMKNHFTAGELYEVVRAKYKNVGFSTVYRTLNILHRCGLARKIQRKDGQFIFEQASKGSHHDHLVCNRCGKYIEFFNQTIEQIQNAVAREHDFVMLGHRLEIFGICSRCQEKSDH